MFNQGRLILDRLTSVNVSVNFLTSNYLGYLLKQSL